MKKRLDLLITFLQTLLLFLMPGIQAFSQSEPFGEVQATRTEEGFSTLLTILLIAGGFLAISFVAWVKIQAQKAEKAKSRARIAKRMSKK